MVETKRDKKGRFIKGNVHTTEVIEKIRIASTGRKQSIDFIKKNRERMLGNKFNLGKKLSAETRLKLSIAHKGKTPSNFQKIQRLAWKKNIGREPPNKGKKSKHAGQVHWNWQGGKTKQREVIRKSLEYKEWRRAIFKRDKYRCIFCNSNKNIEADHIKPFCAYPQLRFEISNGRTLCHECHKKTDTYGEKAKKKQRTGGEPGAFF
jgi:hypothetical protein